MDPIERQIPSERCGSAMPPSGVQDQGLPGRDVETDVFFPDRQRAPAHDDQLVVAEHPIRVGPLAAADEQATRSNFDAERW
jgi:hypothetical protein